uniref:Uncharacterized protein n=1 Tax=Anguilla anguilla TaxID=7936 RepID=A0A0E9S5B9_ANGAN
MKMDESWFPSFLPPFVSSSDVAG